MRRRRRYTSRGAPYFVTGCVLLYGGACDEQKRAAFGGPNSVEEISIPSRPESHPSSVKL